MSQPAWFQRLATAITAASQPPFGERVTPLPPSGTVARHSAVLALFAESDAEGELLLTQRAATLRAHPGQVAFPGGGIDPGDDGPVGAALREAQEEAGLDPASVDVAGLGPQLFLPVTNYYVTPVVGWWRERGTLTVGDPAEVDRVVMVRLSELTDPACRFSLRHPSGYVGPAFAAGGMLIWGFTAGVITWMLQLAGLEREWDAAATRELPAQPVRGERELQQFLQTRAESADGMTGGPSGPAVAQGRGRREELGMAE